jgi:PmbA protein
MRVRERREEEGKNMVKEIMKMGADEVELIESHTQNISYFSSKEKRYSMYSEGEYALRVILNKSMGFLYFNRPSLDIATLAFKMARSAEPNPRWKHLPLPQKVDFVSGLFHTAMEDIEIEDLFEGLDFSVTPDRRIKSYESGGFIKITTRSLINSHGIDLSEKSSKAGIFISLRVGNTQGTDVGIASDSGINHHFDAQKLSEQAYEEAVKSLEKTKIEDGESNIIMAPVPFSNITVNSIVPSFLGDTVYHGVSIMGNQLGKKISSDDITLIEDPTIPGVPQSKSFDDEGSPAQKIHIIQKGILNGFLYDTFYGNLASGSTGNSVRYSKYRGKNLRFLPQIAATALYLHGKSLPFCELLEEMNRGVVVKEVANVHAVNPMTGFFSLPVTSGFFVEDGEITGGIKPFILTGNSFDMIKDISAISTERKRTQTSLWPTVVDTGHVYTRSLTGIQP